MTRDFRQKFRFYKVCFFLCDCVAQVSQCFRVNSPFCNPILSDWSLPMSHRQFARVNRNQIATMIHKSISNFLRSSKFWLIFYFSYFRESLIWRNEAIFFTSAQSAPWSERRKDLGFSRFGIEPGEKRTQRTQGCRSAEMSRRSLLLSRSLRKR